MQSSATRCLTMLDGSGDTTIVWDEATDDKMLAVIQARMDQGYQFYILKPRAIPILPPRKVLAKTIKEVKDAGSVVILDDDIHTLFVNGDVQTIKAEGELEVVAKEKSAKKVSKSQSVAVKPARGG